jgi:hypothetical protein
MQIGALVRVADAAETNIPDALYDKVALWSEPDTFGHLLCFLDPHSVVLVVDVEGDGYAKIVYGGMVGYLHTDYLKELSACHAQET